MSWVDVLGITPVPFVSVLLWLILAMLVLYLARSSAHKIIRTICDALHDAMSIGAQAAANAQQRLGERNREVLLAAGQETKERIIVATVTFDDRSRLPDPARRHRGLCAERDEAAQRQHRSARIPGPSRGLAPPRRGRGWPLAVINDHDNLEQLLSG